MKGISEVFCVIAPPCNGLHASVPLNLLLVSAVVGRQCSHDAELYMD
jgi:hypothetical protein